MGIVATLPSVAALRENRAQKQGQVSRSCTHRPYGSMLKPSMLRGQTSARDVSRKALGAFLIATALFWSSGQAQAVNLIADPATEPSLRAALPAAQSLPADAGDPNKLVSDRANILQPVTIESLERELAGVWASHRLEVFLRVVPLAELPEYGPMVVNILEAKPGRSLVMVLTEDADRYMFGFTPALARQLQTVAVKDIIQSSIEEKRGTEPADARIIATLVSVLQGVVRFAAEQPEVSRPLPTPPTAEVIPLPETTPGPQVTPRAEAAELPSVPVEPRSSEPGIVGGSPPLNLFIGAGAASFLIAFFALWSAYGPKKKTKLRRLKNPAAVHGVLPDVNRVMTTKPPLTRQAPASKQAPLPPQRLSELKPPSMHESESEHASPAPEQEPLPPPRATIRITTKPGSFNRSALDPAQEAGTPGLPKIAPPQAPRSDSAQQPGAAFAPPVGSQEVKGPLRLSEVRLDIPERSPIRASPLLEQPVVETQEGAPMPDEEDDIPSLESSEQNPEEYQYDPDRQVLRIGETAQAPPLDQQLQAAPPPLSPPPDFAQEQELSPEPVPSEGDLFAQVRPENVTVLSPGGLPPTFPRGTPLAPTPKSHLGTRGAPSARPIGAPVAPRIAPVKKAAVPLPPTITPTPPMTQQPADEQQPSEELPTSDSSSTVGATLSQLQQYVSSMQGAPADKQAQMLRGLEIMILALREELQNNGPER